MKERYRVAKVEDILIAVSVRKAMFTNPKNKELVKKLFETMYEELPEPKKKK